MTMSCSLVLRYVEPAIASVLEKTAAKLDSYFVHKEFFVIYGDISKVDILVGEVLNMQQDVIAYHQSNSTTKLIDLMDESLCKELDVIFYAVLKQQKNFKHAIKQLKHLLDIK